jgi:hypothetical protein
VRIPVTLGGCPDDESLLDPRLREMAILRSAISLRHCFSDRETEFGVGS